MILENQEFLNLMMNGIINADEVNESNMAAFKRCCRLLYNIDVCDTCSSVKRNYLIMLKEFWNRQLAKGWNPNLDKSIPDDLID